MRPAEDGDALLKRKEGGREGGKKGGREGELIKTREGGRRGGEGTYLLVGSEGLFVVGVFFQEGGEVEDDLRRGHLEEREREKNVSIKGGREGGKCEYQGRERRRRGGREGRREGWWEGESSVP